MDAILTVSTVSAPLAAGQTAGKFRVTICMADGSKQQTQMFDPTKAPDSEVTDDTLPLFVVFQDITPGDWIVTATRLDQNGAFISQSVSRTFNVANTEAGTTQVPGTITFQLQ